MRSCNHNPNPQGRRTCRSPHLHVPSPNCTLPRRTPTSPPTTSPYLHVPLCACDAGGDVRWGCGLGCDVQGACSQPPFPSCSVAIPAGVHPAGQGRAGDAGAARRVRAPHRPRGRSACREAGRIRGGGTHLLMTAMTSHDCDREICISWTRAGLYFMAPEFSRILCFECNRGIPGSQFSAPFWLF